MLTILSPAKSLDYETPVRIRRSTEPRFLAEASRLSDRLGEMSADELSELMNISSNLAELNFGRYANWQTPFPKDTARQAIFAFRGDVYLGLKAENFSAQDVSFAQNHLRILSGLYGILRPLDLILPYRLEMGTRLKNGEGKDLYAFWGSKLTHCLNTELACQRSKALINLASNEYFNSLQPKDIEADIIQPVFKDFSSGKYRVLSFFAKKARGEMAAFIVRDRIDSPEGLRDFVVDGYRFSETESTESRPVFLRKERV